MNRHAYVRYLPVDRDEYAWGLHMLDCGITDMVSGASYPNDVQHPEVYVASWDEGRILSEYQIVYITKGRGRFKSAHVKERQIHAGDIILVFPGEWHIYQRDEEEGWDECWVGFSGKTAEQLMSHFFSVENPVLHVGFDISLYQVMRSLPDLMEEGRPGYKQLLAAKTSEIIALIRSLNMSDSDAQAERLIQSIRMQMIVDIGTKIDFHEVATSVGMSYSSFRKFFKERMGTPPNQYLIDMRINRAKELLIHSDQSVLKIAEVLGFESSQYFSRLFKGKTGCCPSGFRERERVKGLN